MVGARIRALQTLFLLVVALVQTLPPCQGFIKQCNPRGRSVLALLAKENEGDKDNKDGGGEYDDSKSVSGPNFQPSSQDLELIRHQVSKTVYGGVWEDNYSQRALWAHEINEIERGSVLLSTVRSEQGKPNVVVLLLKHDENTGSVGLVLNRPEGYMKFKDLHGLHPSIRAMCGNNPIHYGGPEDPMVLSMLQLIETPGSELVAPGIFLSHPSPSVWHNKDIRSAAESSLLPEAEQTEIDCCFCVELSSALKAGKISQDNLWLGRGKITWGPGELEGQRARGAWLARAASAKALLGAAADTSPLWRKIHNLTQARVNRKGLYE
mmetsp:Transcript_35311/g.55479  ORF Transcript_35311/g.55479 Transcript_35311/m.55479 type:complete len:323 (-) Transcript_35311:606-1574(-)